MSNRYQALAAILAPKPLLSIVTVVTINGDGTSIVEYPGGAQAIVRGTAVAEGGKAFVQNGEIRGEAPPLDSITIDV